MIGQVYEALGLFDRAQPVLERALAIADGDPRRHPAAALEARVRLANVCIWRGELERAGAPLEPVSATLGGAPGGDQRKVVLALTSIGRLAFVRGDYERAASTLERAREVAAQVDGSDSPAVADILPELAHALSRLPRRAMPRSSLTHGTFSPGC